MWKEDPASRSPDVVMGRSQRQKGSTVMGPVCGIDQDEFALFSAPTCKLRQMPDHV